MMDDDDPSILARSPRKKERKKKPPRLTKIATERAALHYLGRYDCTIAQLRTVLMRRVQRAARLGADEQTLAAATAIIADILQSFTDKAYLDDRRFAAQRRDNAVRDGRSRRDLTMRLRLKGVATDDIDQTIAAFSSHDEFAAACTHARKRRLGPFRPDPETRKMSYQKDLAAMARAGFDLDLARRILDAATPEELEDEIASDRG